MSPKAFTNYRFFLRALFCRLSYSPANFLCEFLQSVCFENMEIGGKFFFDSPEYRDPACPNDDLSFEKVLSELQAEIKPSAPSEEFIKNEEIQTAFLDCLSEHPRIRNGPDGIAFFEEFFAEEH